MNLLERSVIQHSVQYQQGELFTCGTFSLASALHHVRDFNLSKQIHQLYHNVIIHKKDKSQVNQCVEYIQKDQNK